MTRIEATIQTTNEALRAGLREPETKTFKNSPRGLVSAVAWLDERIGDLEAAQGNLSGARPTLKIGAFEASGKAAFYDVVAEIAPYNGSSTTREAAKFLSGIAS